MLCGCMVACLFVSLWICFFVLIGVCACLFVCSFVCFVLYMCLFVCFLVWADVSFLLCLLLVGYCVCVCVISFFRSSFHCLLMYVSSCIYLFVCLLGCVCVRLLAGLFACLLAQMFVC